MGEALDAIPMLTNLEAQGASIETMPRTIRRQRIYYMLWIALVMAAGLLWRSQLFSFSSFFFKYGGDALWALLVFLGFGLFFRRASISKLALTALVFSWIIEFLQLYHAPWIDHMRSTGIGGLILGYAFNIPDLFAYAIGIALGAAAEYICFTVRSQESK
jgi:hypothetical protein